MAVRPRGALSSILRTNHTARTMSAVASRSRAEQTYTWRIRSGPASYFSGRSRYPKDPRKTESIAKTTALTAHMTSSSHGIVSLDVMEVKDAEVSIRQTDDR